MSLAQDPGEARAEAVMAAIGQGDRDKVLRLCAAAVRDAGAAMVFAGRRHFRH